jgi:amino acid transporter
VIMRITLKPVLITRLGSEEGNHFRRAVVLRNHLTSRKQQPMANLRRSLGAIEAFGFSLSMTAPTMAMAFNTTLMAQSAGRAVPLTYLIGGITVTFVALSFVTFSRRFPNAGSVYAYVGSVLGARCGFIAGWALLLAYVAGTAATTALVGNFGAAGLGHAGMEGHHLWLLVSALGGLLAAWLSWRDMRLATHLMLALEAVSILVILILAVVVVKQAPLSLLPFKPEPNHGWAGVGYGLVFAVLSFAGFEGATTLGEETRDPGSSIPKAVVGTVSAAVVFYVFVSYAQVIGFGVDNAQMLGHASAPLDELSTRFISGTFAVFLDFAAATSALACAIGSLAAAARMLYALSRAGLLPGLDEVDARHGTPARAVWIMAAINLVCLFLWGARSDSVSYSGDVATIATLALILVYIGVAGAQAADAFSGRRPAWWINGCLGMILLAWPLWNSVYPLPAWPGNVWPYIVGAWLVLGILIACFCPSVTPFEGRVLEADD